MPALLGQADSHRTLSAWLENCQQISLLKIIYLHLKLIFMITFPKRALVKNGLTFLGPKNLHLLLSTGLGTIYK